jgi:thiol:disulfide interchange protein DsbA
LPCLPSPTYYGYLVEELHMSESEVMVEWAVKNSIGRDEWLAAYNSPQVAQQIERARALTAQYDIQGTPSLAVDSRYLTSGSMHGQRHSRSAADSRRDGSHGA